jgi:hypothetical protein
MTKTKIRFETVTLEEIKKILPPDLLDGSGNHNNHRKIKKKDQPIGAKSGKAKAKSRS